MFKKLLIFMILSIMALLILSCNIDEEQEFIVQYNENDYTSLCEYGEVYDFWDLPLNEDEYEWEEIPIKNLIFKQKAKKLKSDEETKFILANGFLCIRKDIVLPTVKDNSDDITSIQIYLDESTITLTDKEKIKEFSDLFLMATANANQTKDYEYDIIGYVYVNYKDMPLQFSAAKILKDKSGNFYLSSRINPNIFLETLRAPLYSIPLNIDSE